MEFARRTRALVAPAIGVILVTLGAASGAEIASGDAGFRADVLPFFNTHCVGCHGPKKSKGEITLHTLNGEFSAGPALDRWELILEMLESGEMPPEDEPQPAAAERKAVAKWIEAGLRSAVG